MITAHNIKRYTNLPFQQYLNLPGFSHSYLKREVNGLVEVFTPTEKMMLGTLVDDIRSGGTPDMQHKLYPLARQIAHEIYKKYSGILNLMTPQVSYTCDLRYSGFYMPIRTRPDFERRSIAIVDLKVTHEKNIKAVCDFFRYDNQQYAYTLPSNVPVAYILAYSVPLKACELFPVDLSRAQEFWKEKILKFGTLCAD